MDDFGAITRLGSSQADLDRDQQRIAAEILGNGSTDPFVSAVRATHMPMIITNPRLADNPVVFVNDAFCRLTGYVRAEIVGRNCRFLQGPATDPGTIDRIREAVRNVLSIQIDVRNHRKNGAPFWNRLLMAPVRDAAGELAYYFSSHVDVTLELERLAGLESHNAALLAELSDRLRGQEESEARLRFATQAGRLGIWELDLHTRELTTSAMCREIFGRESSHGFTFADMAAAVHLEDRVAMEAAVRHSVTTGSDYQVEMRVIRPNGSTGWVDARAQVMRASDGDPLRLAGTALDITERKKAEASSRALLELDNRFRTLETPAELARAAAEILGRTLEVSRAGYCTVDPLTRDVVAEQDWHGPGLAPLAGHYGQQAFALHTDALHGGETVVVSDVAADHRTADHAASLAARQIRAFVTVPVMEQASLVAMLFLAHEWPREWSSDMLGFVSEVALRTRMVVERRRAEQDLRRLATSLEVEVASRTEALMATEAALRQSQKMEAVGQLTGGLAHDFNNLLTGITGSLELLKTRAAQGRLADVDRYVKAAQSAASRAAALTHRLLAFSRRQTLEPKATDVNRLITGLEELIRRTMGPAVAVKVAGARGLWHTMVDQSQLENALLNLCINARDAMPDGGQLTINTSNHQLDAQVAAARDLPRGEYVALSVSDTGTGMTPEVIAKAFDPFFTTKPIGQGTGLGLSMFYGFAQQSGGQARIQSEVGVGSTLWLYLPRSIGTVEEADTPPELSSASGSSRGETVLVVDDELTIRMLVADIMTDLGYNTIEAADGRRGLEVLRSDQPIDLLVTDVGLPGGINGWQVAEAGRALRPDLKVLFITGYTENTAPGQGALQRGMQILTKPFPVEALASRIRELIASG